MSGIRMMAATTTTAGVAAVMKNRRDCRRCLPPARPRCRAEEGSDMRSGRTDVAIAIYRLLGWYRILPAAVPPCSWSDRRGELVELARLLQHPGRLTIGL